MKSAPTNIEDIISSYVLEIFHSKEVQSECRKFINNIDYRKFYPDNSLENRIALHQAVHTYLQTGSKQEATIAAKVMIDIESREMEVVNLVNQSEFLSEITQKIYGKIASNNDFQNKKRCLEITGRTLLYALVDLVQKADKSEPLDIGNGQQVTVCYIPGSSEENNYQDVITSSWLKRSNALSIFPDQTFCDFLKVVGVSKADWLAVVNSEATPSKIKQMEKHMNARRVEWGLIEDWDCNGSLDIDTEDLVAAVDACPYGFTPVIAFTMPAEEIFSMSFEEAINVTGGIVGLHDFKTGSGDPLRFEGTLQIAPQVGDMHLADDQPLGLIATHGFLSDSFNSKVERVHKSAITPRH